MGTVVSRAPGQVFALVFGSVYVLVGIVGMFVGTGTLIAFDINLLHSFVHVGIGALYLVGSRSATMARQVNLLIGVVVSLVAVLGFVAPGLMQDLLNINMADNFLHLATALVSVYVGTAGAGVRAATA
jgi:hypothetical protein